MKNLLLVALVTLGLTASTMAQNLPNYVPSNGILGWWPFNGNANDESVNGNNGTVNGATLTTDRFGNANSAYSFDGVNDNILVQMNSTLAPSGKQNYTYSLWFQANPGEGVLAHIFTGTSGANISNYGLGFDSSRIDFNHYPFINYQTSPDTTARYIWTNILVDINQVNDTVKFYKNGIYWYEGLVSTLEPSAGLLAFGALIDNNGGFEGKIDDIGIWGRSLSQQEITNLYNSTNCSNNLTISSATSQLQTGNTAIFSATTSDVNPSYVWQSNFGQGYQTLNDVENYSGTNTSSLNISNVQLSEHNQPIRVITTSGECVDTSNIATISILDTCITIINDTTFISVTDTLVINTLITAINQPNNSNTIKVFPNPANSHITIDYGNFVIMNGYQLKIENSIGQQVFQTNINQQTDYLSLNNWGGNGLYFVHIIDAQGNTIDIRKIVLQ